MQALRAAQHRRQRLVGGAYHVVVDLLGGERRTAGLGVEAQPPAAFVARSELVANDLRPHAPGRPELGGLLEDAVVAGAEERQPWGEIIHSQGSPKRAPHLP